jgi:hypothetical protein
MAITVKFRNSRVTLYPDRIQISPYLWFPFRWLTQVSNLGYWEGVVGTCRGRNWHYRARNSRHNLPSILPTSKVIDKRLEIEGMVRISDFDSVNPAKSYVNLCGPVPRFTIALSRFSFIMLMAWRASEPFT